MSDWLLWMSLAGVLLILEMFSGGFYLVMIGIGFFAGGLAALSGAPYPTQLAIAGIVGMAATYLLWRVRLHKRLRAGATEGAAGNLDIGQSLHVQEWRRDGGLYTARASYRGADWDVELVPGAAPASGRFVIREIRGNRLIVEQA